MACRADSAVSSDGGKRPLEGGEEEASRKAPRTEEKKMEDIGTTVSCNPKIAWHTSTTERMVPSNSGSSTLKYIV